MQLKKCVATAVLSATMCIGLAACTESSQVSYNVSKEANNFNVMRKITVLNSRNDSVLFELTGRFSLQNEGNNELSIICETEDGEYKKDFIYLNDWTTYVVEDLDANTVDKYHYELNILPQFGVEITTGE